MLAWRNSIGSDGQPQQQHQTKLVAVARPEWGPFLWPRGGGRGADAIEHRDLYTLHLFCRPTASAPPVPLSRPLPLSVDERSRLRRRHRHRLRHRRSLMWALISGSQIRFSAPPLPHRARGCFWSLPGCCWIRANCCQSLPPCPALPRPAQVSVQPSGRWS